MPEVRHSLAGTLILMAAEKTEALVIRQADFSESSRVITLFTRDFGKLAVIAKGVKRLRSPFEAALDLLTRCRIVFLRKSSGGLEILTEAQLSQRFTPPPGQLLPLYAGYYVAELLDSLSEDDDPHPLLFDAATATLARLQEPAVNVTATVFHFELAILKEIGLLPTLDACVGCERPLPGSGRLGFKVAQGGFLCPSCGNEDLVGQFTMAGTVAALRRLAEEPDPSRIPLAPAQQAEIRRVLTAAIAQILGRKPRMLRYLGA